MNRLFLILILCFVISCGEKTPKQSFAIEENSGITPYDTIAIDSFSPGATSVDIVRKIKMSSLKYQDSLKRVKMQTDEEQLLKKAKEDLEKTNEKLESAKEEISVNP
jgi:hypothetical protein